MLFYQYKPEPTQTEAVITLLQDKGSPCPDYLFKVQDQYNLSSDIRPKAQDVLQDVLEVLSQLDE